MNITTLNYAIDLLDRRARQHTEELMHSAGTDNGSGVRGRPLRTEMRILWRKHVELTRQVIEMTVDRDVGNLDYVRRTLAQARKELLANQDNIGSAVGRFLGAAGVGETVTRLLREHILGALGILVSLTSVVKTARAATQSQRLGNLRVDNLVAVNLRQNPTGVPTNVVLMMLPGIPEDPFYADPVNNGGLVLVSNLYRSVDAALETIQFQPLIFPTQGQHNDLVTAIKSWYDNADALAAYLAGVAPGAFSAFVVGQLLHRHLWQTIVQAVQLVNGEAAASQHSYEEALAQGQTIANALTDGLERAKSG